MNWHRLLQLSRRTGLLGSTILIAVSPRTSEQVWAQQPEAAALALTDVTVIDVVEGRLLPRQTVVVAGGKVLAVGPTRDARLPKGAVVVDARGKYLVPGFWDMHVHMEDTIGAASVVDSLYRANYPRFIAHGITGVREMAQRFQDGADSFRLWQRAVLAGARVGPRAIGPSADLVSSASVLASSGPAQSGRGYYTVKIPTPDDAARIVDSLKAAGIVFLKFHDDFADLNTYFAVARAARRVGLPLVGHTPFESSDGDVADSGQRSIEHVNEIRCYFHGPVTEAFLRQFQVQPDTAEERTCAAAAAAAFVRNDTWLVPTFINFAVKDTTNNINRELVSRGHRAVQTLQRFGVTKFLAGTDFGIGHDLAAGFSLLQEIVQLVEAGGLTPLEALQAATLNPAKFFNAADSLGTVAPGKLADLVLLDSNPLTDIHNVMTTHAVVANGRYFNRAALDAMDPEGGKLAKVVREQLIARPAAPSAP